MFTIDFLGSHLRCRRRRGCGCGGWCRRASEVRQDKSSGSAAGARAHKRACTASRYQKLLVAAQTLSPGSWNADQALIAKEHCGERATLTLRLVVDEMKAARTVTRLARLIAQHRGRGLTYET